MLKGFSDLFAKIIPFMDDGVEGRRSCRSFLDLFGFLFKGFQATLLLPVFAGVLFPWCWFGRQQRRQRRVRYNRMRLDQHRWERRCVLNQDSHWWIARYQAPYCLQGLYDGFYLTAAPLMEDEHVISGIWVFPKIGVSQSGWFIIKNPIKIDDFWGGTPYF